MVIYSLFFNQNSKLLKCTRHFTGLSIIQLPVIVDYAEYILHHKNEDLTNQNAKILPTSVKMCLNNLK